MRLLVVFARLFPFVLAFLWDRRRFILFGRPPRRNDERHRRRAARLTRTVAELGPTFIKLAQVFAARADILPEPYLSSIGTLTDQVPPLPPGVAEAGGPGRAGRPMRRRPSTGSTRSRSPRPRWVRCTGPRTAGREVVVKVLRPGRRGGGPPRPRHLVPDPVPAQPAVSRPPDARHHGDRERVLPSASPTSSTSGRRRATPRPCERNFAAEPQGGGAGGGDRPGAAPRAGARVRGGHPDRPAAASGSTRGSCASTR